MANRIKSLLLVLLIASIETVYAIPGKPVVHAHGGRVHRHPLPPEGISHRHGRGEPGVMVQSTHKAGTITSSVEYEGRHSKPKNDSIYVIRPQTSQITIEQNSNHSRAKKTGVKEIYIKQDAHIKNNRFKPLYDKGDTSCRPGESDCNICASNVQQQFKQAAARQISWRTKPWRFSWPQKYPPSGLRPLDIFDGDPAYAFGIPDTHVQGFVRTNSVRFPYAGSHSHKRRGGIFLIRQARNGKKYLSSLYPTHSKHPSGVQVLGNYLMYGENNKLTLKNLDHPNQNRDIILPISKANFGGGLAAVRLSKGRYLLVTSGPGGQNNRPRFNRFYLLQGRNGRPDTLSFIDESQYVKPSQWPRNFAFSENLSLITECGTGDIYAIHTTGDEKGIKAINGNGYWRLSRLQNQQNKLVLNPLNAFTTRQNMASCNVRAAATIYVNRQHKMEFYCHAYAKDPDGSTFNILGPSSRKADKFYFKAGTVN